MDIKNLAEILQTKLPEALRSFAALDAETAPLLNAVNANRDKIDPENVARLDKAMLEIKQNRQKLREYGLKNQ